MAEDRIIGGLEANVDHINESINDMREMMTDLIRDSSVMREQILTMKQDIHEMKAAQATLRKEVMRLSIMIGGCGLVAGGGGLKLFQALFGG